MNAEPFMPYYHDGQRVTVGDVVKYVDGPLRVITNVFDPAHEISLLYSMARGCVEIAPATIENLPLDEDILLIRRGELEMGTGEMGSEVSE